MPKSRLIPSPLQMLEPNQSEEADNDLILLMDYNTISLLFSYLFIENDNKKLILKHYLTYKLGSIHSDSSFSLISNTSNDFYLKT